MMSRFAGLLACGMTLFAATAVFADSAALDQLYGDGVHNFFSGDFVGAHQALTSAALSGSKDPRVYYYRGLACLRLGREPDAVIDFNRGARLETSENDRFYDISR